MNWGDFKNNVLELGFQEEFNSEDEVVRATNRALTLLSTMEPKEKVYTYNNLDTSDSIYVILDMSTITDYSSKSNKLPKQENELISGAFYEVDTLYIPNEIKGNISVFYNATPNKITITSLDIENIDLKEELIPFLQLLTAYFMWLDDDERKAITYYNQFQESYNYYKQNTYIDKPIARVIGGIDI